ncbi:MAG: 16S rRNA (guanine(966)-N(2))-methyltransferase RsmD [bacterium]|jgi:16S rRNA (guanine966-N2)-methyltransferase|nr:MAG: 16S rRNA (guanine(966)-N(2))-methyltransferase RsmD [bacterium]
MRIIAGRWRGHRIEAPPGRHTRPTTDRVREAWMSALQPALPGATVLDLFAGSGALGLEALSRGAARVVFVEKAGRALRALRANIERLGAEGQTEVVRADALAYVAGLPLGAFDLALADPPYGEDLAAELVRQFTRRPFARQLWIEHSAKETLPETPGQRTRRYGDTALTMIPAPE